MSEFVAHLLEMAIWISEAEVKDVLDLSQLVETIERAMVAFSAGQANQPVRTVLQSPGGVFASMPAYLGSIPAMGGKLVTVFHGNTSKGLPTHLATIVLLDPDTGGLLATMDGRYITEVRTAAASGVAARHLALPDASVLAIIGSGVQARSHLALLPSVLKFKEIRCWSPTTANVRALVAEYSKLPLRAVASAQAAIAGADVIALVTASSTPVIKNTWVKPGACVVSVGACRPTEREMDPELVARAVLVVDSREAALRESGDIVQGIKEGRFDATHIAAELGEVAGKLKSGRTHPDQVTIFKSLGMAVEDVAAADLVYRRAIQLGKGAGLA
jgi:alanine dehydrogenase